ncbi:MAG: flippase [Anaerolineae bacterium]|nr:flippase [Anaerolineae bacterium]
MENLETPTQPKRNVGRIIARNTAVGVASQFALKMVGFLYNVLVINHLGDSSYGQYNIVLSWAYVFAFLGDIGISQFYTREIARDRSKGEKWFWDVVALRFILAIVASVATTGAAIIFHHPPEIVLAVGLYTATYFLQALLEPLRSIIEGNERIDITSVLGVINQIIFMGFGAIFLFLGGDFVWLVVAALLVIPINIVISLVVIRRNKLAPPPFQLHIGQWWVLLRGGLPFALIQLSLSFAFYGDTLFLKQYGYSDELIGWYGASYALMLTASVITSAFNRALLPSLAREHAENPESVRPWYYRSVKAMAFMGIPLAVGGVVLSDKIISFLYPEYPPASVAFAILIWYMPMHIYTAFAGNMSNSIKEENKAARIYFGEGVVNIILYMILIPPFGLVGASFATVLTEVYASFLFYILYRRTFGPGLNFQKMSRLVLSAALMGVVVFLARDLNLFLAIAIGVVVYLMLVWLTRAFSESEVEMVKRVLDRVRGRLFAASSV